MVQGSPGCAARNARPCGAVSEHFSLEHHQDAAYVVAFCSTALGRSTRQVLDEPSPWRIFRHISRSSWSRSDRPVWPGTRADSLGGHLEGGCVEARQRASLGGDAPFPAQRRWVIGGGSTKRPD